MAKKIKANGVCAICFKDLWDKEEYMCIDCEIAYSEFEEQYWDERSYIEEE